MAFNWVSEMVVTLGQQFNVGEKSPVILYTYIIRHAGTTHDKDKRHDEPVLQISL